MEGSLIEKTSFRPYLVVSAPSTGASNVLEAKNIPLLFQNEEHMCEVRSFDQGPLPTLSLPSLPSLHSAFAPMWSVLKEMCEKLSTLHSQFVQMLLELAREIAEYNNTQKDKLKSNVSL